MHVLTQLAAGPQDEKRGDEKQIERTKSAEDCIAEVCETSLTASLRYVKRLFLSLCALFC